jgi:hypothetical protein
VVPQVQTQAQQVTDTVNSTVDQVTAAVPVQTPPLPRLHKRRFRAAS